MAALRGEEGWGAAHARTYGEERWQELRWALEREVEHVCFLNPFLHPEARTRIEHEYRLQPTPIPGAFTFDVPADPQEQYAAVDENDESTIFVAPRREALDPTKPEGPAPFFFVDGASVIAALALNVEPEDRVLDVCAAPGGKGLVLAAALFARRCQEDLLPELFGRLVLNEVSKPKASRTQRVVADFLPPLLFDVARPRGPHVIFTAADAGTTSNTMERHGPYDKILLDAPCTNDRHLLREGPASALGRWSNGTPKVASEKQLKLLYNALWLLKEGGVLLYCNSALAPEECDGVIERLLLKVRGSFEIEVLPLEERVCRMVPGLTAESNDWGTRILPDRTPFGPIYFSRLRLLRRTHQASLPPGVGF